MRIDSGFIEPFNFAAVGARQLTSRARVLEVRIQSPPADSPSLAGFLLPCIEKRAVAAACAGPARWHGRQRHARPVNITPIAGNVSVEPHSSTAMPPARFGDSEAPVHSKRVARDVPMLVGR